MSRTEGWRDECVSSHRDRHPCWLHRLVRPSLVSSFADCDRNHGGDAKWQRAASGYENANLVLNLCPLDYLVPVLLERAQMLRSLNPPRRFPS